MSKRILLLSSLFGACATGQMIGMQCPKTKKDMSKNVRSMHKALEVLPQQNFEKAPEQPSLNFTLDPKRQVISYLAVGMKFDKKPKKFDGKDLLKIIALSKSDRRALKKAFKHAVATEKPQFASYLFKKGECVALIKPLFKGAKGKKAGFSVEVYAKQ